MVFWQECLYALVDALGICKFQTVFLSPNMPKWKEYAKLLEKVVGLSFSEEQLMEIGERIYNLERMFLIREGITRKDDNLPERYFQEPTPAGLEAVKGKVIDRSKFEHMLDEYYELHGWDQEGKPLPATLARLGLQEEPSGMFKPQGWAV